LVVDPFQRTMLRPFFPGAREAVNVAPKANAKTTTTAVRSAARSEALRARAWPRSTRGRRCSRSLECS
jgi:hypothetical protein